MRIKNQKLLILRKSTFKINSWLCAWFSIGKQYKYMFNQIYVWVILNLKPNAPLHTMLLFFGLYFELLLIQAYSLLFWCISVENIQMWYCGIGMFWVSSSKSFATVSKIRIFEYHAIIQILLVSRYAVADHFVQIQWCGAVFE